MNGEDRIAERPAYVVKVTRQLLDRCAAPGAPGQTDMFWVAKESFVLLRAEQHQPQVRVGQELVTYTVGTVEYDVAIPDSVYAYSPPAQSILLNSLSDLKAALGSALQP